MRKSNEFNIFKSQKNNPRILKVTQLIKKTLSEVFLTMDFTYDNGKSIILFINKVTLSKDAKIATVFITNFSDKNFISKEQFQTIIESNLSRIKKEFSSRIELRYTPKLKFRLDEETERLFELNKVLNDLR